MTSYYVNTKISILFGSQTGNAQDLAERIWRESKKYYFKSSIKSLDNYDINSLLVDECIIFICSTTGQGDVPDNMKKFWKFILRKNLDAGVLSHLKYAVLGLGDSSYVKFNFTAKKLFKRLQHLGGTPIIPLGLGDDQHDLGYDAVSDPWIDNLWKELLMLYPLPHNIKPISNNTSVCPRWKISSKLLDEDVDVRKSNSIYFSTRQPNQFDVEVIENSRITDSSHFQEVRLIKLKTTGQSYCPGDIVVLRPKNLSWQINEFQQVLSSNGVNIPNDLILSVKEKDVDTPVPDIFKYNVTFGQLCEEYFDLMSVPRRYTFEILANITDSELEREKCREFTTAEGQNELFTYCNRPKRNIVEVLQDFPNATKNLTIDMLFEIFSPIKPREFSIASNFNWHKNEIHILLAVVKYKTKLLKERFGLCSNYLAGLNSGDIVTAWIRKGSFKFPIDDVPIIMVGPGTGLAPFRNFIYECVHRDIASSKKLVLLFGCRNEGKDFHCRDELQKLHSSNKLNLICAFSRDQKEKVYVQDKIREHKMTVWSMLETKCMVFIAGNSKFMPQDVRKAFVDVCKECGSMNDNEAEQYIAKMEFENRYQTECW
ncbi:hypothetical protein WA026_014513 [Henosepilachna vigintioctopunctata]|uniref:NADPH-dependent diflavin oxidoreductase 1 n=1 Tax=Henosepilachna vigintioctopunctata TaxID=420089 RepID=A0AAW1UMC2_9CUCU